MAKRKNTPHVGDLAWHRDGYDPRPVAEVDEHGDVRLFILTRVSNEFYHRGNYTYEPLTFPACSCGSVDKHGDDLGEHSPECPYHLAALRATERGWPEALVSAVCKNTLGAMSRA